ncbi:MAG: Uma2 family endonuclease [Candidatus Brocadia sp.]|jgi:hypothetical protein
MSLPKDGYKHELINGEFTMVLAGFEHEYVGVKLIAALENFVSRKKLGAVFGSGMGYWMKSENLRSPDVSFISRERLQKFNRMPKGFFKGSPDLAVEILSLSDTVEGMHGKDRGIFWKRYGADMGTQIRENKLLRYVILHTRTSSSRIKTPLKAKILWRALYRDQGVTSRKSSFISLII